MAKRWLFKGHDAAAIEDLSNRARISPVIAQLLLGRGIRDPETISSFLEVRFADLRDPSLLEGIDQASQLIFDAIQARVPMTVYGDYDADGMTGTAILYSCLSMLGADVQYYVPNRLEDCYGLNDDALRKLAERGRRMVITVDCGIGAIDQAELCRELGLTLIITDHHRPSEQLPVADAIVHPSLPHNPYAFPGLCGAGVAFKLAWALCQRSSQAKKVTTAQREYLLQAMAVAAIGTVADVVPLLDENRILVRHALGLMSKHAPLGLRALLKQTKLDMKSELGAEDISFMLAPRLNAAGRLGQAQLGVELLTTQDPARAMALAEYIDRLNADRDSIERSILSAANKQIKEQYDVENDVAFVLAAPGWHLGVIGIVAGRLAEKYHRPVVVIGMDPTGQKPATGSARSQGIVDLHATLTACQDHLVACGGHAAAAGLRIDERNIHAFREAFCEQVVALGDGELATAQIDIDAETTFQQMNLNTVSTIEKLAPFGAANPRPVLVASNVELSEPVKAMGSGDRHLSGRFAQHGVVMRGVAFGQSEWIEPLNSHRGQIDLAFRPTISEFNGFRRVEMQILDWRVAKLSPPAPHAESPVAARR